jgi:predicted nucleic acid-binding protein
LNSVLLDTSFLITLASSNRSHHVTAQRYLKECVIRRVPMYLSTIVMAEFQVKQAVSDLPLRNLIALPFNADHAIRCGQLIADTGREREGAEDRVRVKDDFKLIAQCHLEGISHVLSEDANRLVKYLQRCPAPSNTRLECVLMRDGFDLSWFEDGQYRLPV